MRSAKMRTLILALMGLVFSVSTIVATADEPNWVSFGRTSWIQAKLDPSRAKMGTAEAADAILNDKESPLHLIAVDKRVAPIAPHYDKTFIEVTAEFEAISETTIHLGKGVVLERNNIFTEVFMAARPVLLPIGTACSNQCPKFRLIRISKKYS